MNVLKIKGGKPLNGEIEVQGSKNSVLPILAATLIHKGESIIHNCPDLRDVRYAISILEYLGCKVKREGKTICVDASGMICSDIPDTLMREMRSSVIFLGAILARCGKAVMSFPGGCELGPRPIDLHLSALKKMGMTIREGGGKINCYANKPSACDLDLAFPSVGATENIMLAASACRGKTRILNAAREPEIEDLQNFLRGMGITVNGAGSSIIEIEGGGETHSTEHTAIADRIVAATYLIACAMCGGDTTLTNLRAEHIMTIISHLEAIGCKIKIDNQTVRIQSDKSLRSLSAIRTLPYPGFPTDAQAPMMALATQCEGTSVFVENIFDNRYRHVCELVRMGADIRVEGKIAVVTGKKILSGAHVMSTDLRGGAALTLAALVAQDETIVDEIWHIDRGYEKIEEYISALGGDIRREKK